MAHRSDVLPFLNPEVVPVMADGEPAVFVRLFGKAAQGDSMLLDRETWAWVRANYGAGWILASDGDDHVYPANMRLAAAYLTRGRQGFPETRLARLIAHRTRASLRHHYWIRNGDPLDLRVCNLMIRRGGRTPFPSRRPPAVIAPDPG